MKKTTPILKNTHKYTDIKLANGILLDNVKVEKRTNSDIGISTKTYGKNWFILPKGKAIFKTFDFYYKDIKNIRIINELLCYELAKQLGVNCAEYELAYKDNKQGVVTYDVAKQNEKLVSAVNWFDKIGKFEPDNNLYSFVDAIEIYINKGYNIDKNEFITDLYKMMIFDCLTVQSDRHLNNIFVLINENEKTIKLAPLIDNEFAFNTCSNDEDFLKDKEISYEKYIDSLIFIYKQLSVCNYNYFDNLFTYNIKQLVYMAKHNPKFDNILKNFYTNYNIKDAIAALKNKGIEINKKYEEYLYMTEKVSKYLLKVEYKRNHKYSNEYDFLPELKQNENIKE